MAELAAVLAATEADRLEQAEALVRAYCGWHVAPSRADVTVAVRATSDRLLLLPTLHLTGVTSVTADGLLVDAGDYSFTAAGVVERVSGCWPATDVTVVFTHGYPGVPREVEAVVQAVAQRAVNNPGSKPREQSGPFADTYSQSGFNQAPALALLDAEKATLDRYRIPPRP